MISALLLAATVVTGTVKFSVPTNVLMKVKSEGCQLQGDGKTFGVDLKTCKDTTFELRDKHTKQALNVEKYPVATLVLDETPGTDKHTFSGKLSLAGNTAPVSGSYDVKDGKLTATFKTSVKAFVKDAPAHEKVVVQDEVTVEVEGVVK